MTPPSPHAPQPPVPQTGGTAHPLPPKGARGSSWTVSPAESGGVSIVSNRFDLLVSTVQVGGGNDGRLYRLTNHVTTAEGREDSRSIMLRVEKR